MEHLSDQPERQRALDTSQSYIVQAPAGSGKTELLIQRYLKLLSVVNKPESVLAITFTRKAAAEMRQRVMAALSMAADPGIQTEKLSQHAQTTFHLASKALTQSKQENWRLDAHPSRLRIMTIDSLNASLIRRMPWLSGAGSDLRIVQQPTQLYEEAAWKTLRLTCDLSGAPHKVHAALQTLLLHLDNNDRRVCRLLIELLAKRDQWLRHLVPLRKHAAVKESLIDMFSQVINDELSSLRKAIPQDIERELMRLADFAATTLHENDQTDSDILHLKDHASLPEASFKSIQAWHGMCELLLTASGEWRKAFTKNQGFPPKSQEKNDIGVICDQLSRQPGLLRKLAYARLLPCVVYEHKQWHLLEALIELLPVTVANLQLVFQQRSSIDFIEQALLAKQALIQGDRITDLTLKLDYQIQHILMDEFQDTSHSQLGLLEILLAGWQPGDGRSLFLVGDPMQSIYRFREADVSGFLRARDQGLAGIRPESIVLSSNFRSSTILVNWFNDVFPDVMADEDDPSLGAVSYSPAVAADSGSSAGGLHMHPVINDGDTDTDEHENQVVVSIIQDIIQSHPDDSIGVLVRSRTHLLGLFSQLNKAGIAFEAVDIVPLLSRPVIQDLFTLTRCLLHRHDRVAWLALLRAPWCGLTLRSLYSLTAWPDKAAHPVDIWSLIKDENVQDTLDNAEKERLVHVVECLRPLMEDPAHVSLPTQVELMWQALGAAHCHNDEQSRVEVELYISLLNRLHIDTITSGDALTIKRIQSELSDSFSSGTASGGTNIHLMTIHKAKGLEFDHVILPALSKGTRSDQKRLLVWHEELGDDYGRRLLLAPIHRPGEYDKSYEFVRQREIRRQEYEMQRLLYVAMTRARSNLHLIGAMRVDADGLLSNPSRGSFLSLLDSHVRDAYLNIVNEDAGQEYTSLPDELIESDGAIYLRRVPLGWRPTIQGINVSFDSQHDPVIEANRIEFSWAGQLARVTGVVTHQYLKLFAENNELLRLNRDELTSKFSTSIHGQLISQGIPEQSVEVATERVLDALMRIGSDERGCWILQAHNDAKNEYAVSAVLDGRIVQRILDRTFVDDVGTRWIIDYKTSVHEGVDVDNFLDQEVTRYTRQMNQYAKIFSLIENRPIQLGLYFPLLGGWREWGWQQ